MFKRVDEIKTDTPELQAIDYSGLCGTLDGQRISHWLYEKDNSSVFIVKGSITVAYNLIPKLEQILSSKSCNVLVQAHAMCMLLWAANDTQDTELLVIVSDTIDEHNPYADVRELASKALKNNALKVDTNADKLNALLESIFNSDTSLDTMEQHVDNHRNKMTVKSVSECKDKQIDRDFWYWAFDNAPKALLNEAYDILYNNLYSRFAELQK